MGVLWIAIIAVAALVNVVAVLLILGKDRLDDGEETTNSSLSINNKNQEHNE